MGGKGDEQIEKGREGQMKKNGTFGWWIVWGK
jgi:hypothetical protein